MPSGTLAIHVLSAAETSVAPVASMLAGTGVPLETVGDAVGVGVGAAELQRARPHLDFPT